MCVLKLSVILLIALLSYVQCDNTPSIKVNVTVYYESLCPDSKSFINEQLTPALTNGSLGDYVNLQLVPFGKSKYSFDGSTNTYKFECHHGEDECRGNKIHACGVERIRDGKRDGDYAAPVVLRFIDCMMKLVNPSATPVVFPTRTCSIKAYVPNFAEVDNCANHIDGNEDLANFGAKTLQLKPSLTSVPTIVFNDLHVEAASVRARKNFIGTLCDHMLLSGIEVGKVAECRANSGSIHVPLVTYVLIASFIAFLSGH